MLKRNHLGQIHIFHKISKAMKVKQAKSAKSDLECLLLVFIYSNSKLKVTCENTDFEYRYNWIHTKQKPSKISNITFIILSSYQKKNTYTEWPS